MEFKVPLPILEKTGSLLQNWTAFCQRFEYHQKLKPAQSSSLLLFAAHHQMADLAKALKSFDLDCPKLSRILQTVEKMCLPYFILLFERFRYFTLIQDASETSQDMGAILVKKQAEICEFGELNESVSHLITVSTAHEIVKLDRKASAQSGTQQPSKDRAVVVSDGSEIGSALQTTSNEKSELQSVPNLTEGDQQLQVSETCGQEVFPLQLQQGTRTNSSSILSQKRLNVSRNRVNNFSTRQSNQALEEEGSRENNWKRPKATGSKRKVVSGKNLTCVLCKKGFKGEKCFRKHVVTKHGDLCEMTCQHCGTTFMDAMEYIEHCHNHNVSPDVACPQTNNDKRSNSLKTYQVFSCDFCNQTYSKEEQLKRHVSSCHSDCANFLCWNCSEVLPDLPAYRLHCETHVVKNRFTCELCHKQHHSITRLIGHLKNHLLCRVKCDICGMVFSKLKYVEAHKRKHVNEPAYECQLCGKNFLTNNRLQYHMQRHSGEKKYTCELCGKSFSQKMSFSYHKLWHAGLKPYACDICGQQYRSSGDLNRHKGKHSNKRSHVCELCGKGFRYSSSLVEHRKGHSDVRSYQCNVCLKTFIYRSGLRNHIREARCPGPGMGSEPPRKSMKIFPSKNVSTDLPVAPTDPKVSLSTASAESWENNSLQWRSMVRQQSEGGPSVLLVPPFY